jgi:hypothetical protein
MTRQAAPLLPSAPLRSVFPRTPFGTNYEVAGAGGIDLSFVRVPTTCPEVR